MRGTRRRQFGLILCLSIATASHAAGLELRQTAWAVQHWEDKGWEVFERYRLYNNYTPQLRVETALQLIIRPASPGSEVR